MDNRFPIYEYKVVDSMRDWRSTPDREDIGARLNDLGRKGWLLQYVQDTGEGRWFLYLVRERSSREVPG